MSRTTGKGRPPGDSTTTSVEMTYQELADALGLASADAARQRATKNKWPTAKGSRQGAAAKVVVPKSALAKPAKKAAKPVGEPVVVSPAPEPVVAPAPEPVTVTVAPAAPAAPEPVVVAPPAPAPVVVPSPVVPSPVVTAPVVTAPVPVAAPAAPPKAAPPLPKVVPGSPGGTLATQPAVLGINREGWMFIALGLGGGWLLGHLWGLFGWLGLAFAVWCAWFFRDPKRVVPVKPGLVVSPADGIVQSIGPEIPPAELEMGTEPRLRISVFMNVFNVHVNRVPVDGRIVRTAYRPGKFFDASLDKASLDNERMSFRLARPDGGEFAVVQIAGLVARRIKCGLVDGQTVRAGERFGLIRFGSRVDVYFPAGAVPLVAIGQTMIAGESVLADLTSAEPARRGETR